jgi:hypothetical protein
MGQRDVAMNQPMENTVRTSFLAAALAASLFSASAMAQVAVPHTFAAGAPARAADVNANFQALATAINELNTRVSKLEGTFTAADVAGTYTVYSIETQVRGGTGFAGVRAMAPFGTFTLAADGSVTGTWYDLGYDLSLTNVAGSMLGTRTQHSSQSTLSSATWSLSGNILTLTDPEGQSTMTGVVGGRIFVGRSLNPNVGGGELRIMVRR